jgi:hypothetical protein
VAYFAVGNSSECFGFIKDWVEKKIRPHGAGPESQRLRLEAVEYAMAVQITRRTARLTARTPSRASRVGTRSAAHRPTWKLPPAV